MSTSHPDAQPLLILDLDETLIFGTSGRLDRRPDALLEPYAIYHRPGAREFLERVRTAYTVSVWTAATSEYAQLVVRSLFPEDLELAFVWSRERCTWRRAPETQEEYWLKNLLKVRRLGHHLDRVLIVDDDPQKLERNYGNLVQVHPWTGDPDDRELERLADYLVSIADRSNFRSLEKRRWREHPGRR